MAQLQTIPKSGYEPLNPYALDAAEIKFYKSEGWLLLPRFVKSSEIESLRQEILDVATACGAKATDLTSANAVCHKLIQTSQYLAGTALDGLVNSAELRSLAGMLLGGGCELYQPFTAVKSGGGGGQFHFHQDNNYTRFRNGLHGINFWFALVDMTPQNGCLCIAPRTHAGGTLNSENVGQGDHHLRVSEDPEMYLPVRMHSGDAVAFSRLTVHGSGMNRSDAPRVGYSVQFFHEDAVATWDGQPPRPLKGSKRFRTGPVAEIDPESDA